MAQLKVFTLDNLTLYDGLIKGYVDAADAKSLKTVAIEGNTLKFYKVGEPVGETVPAYEITLPETDISGLMAKLTGAVEGDVVVANADGTVKDGGVKLADLATKTEVKTVSDKVDAIENAETGILATAKDYTDAEVKELADGAVKANTDAIAKLNGDATTEGSVAKAVKDSADAINATIGTVAEGKTIVEMIADAKTESTYDDTDIKADIEANADAIEALEEDLTEAVTNATVAVSTDTTTEGYLKSYTIKQGETVVATIDIPKDLFAVSGSVVVNPEGQAEGTYVELVIQNQEDPIYIDVASLIDNYKPEEGAAQIQLAINSDTRVISATIVDGAVTTAKIADANVTAAKLADDAKALFDTAGAATTAQTNAQTYADNAVKGLSDGQVKTNKEAIEALQTKVGDGMEAITAAEINALFAE